MSITKSIPVNFQALVSIEPIDERTTKCLFQNIFNGKQFTMTLAITKSQIESWYYGKPIQYAMSNLSKDVQEIFKTGCTDKEFSKLLGSI